jgi:hypothetical protein
VKIEEFEKCFEEDFREWFSKWASLTYLGKGEECLKEIYDLWTKSGGKARYFWLTQTGRVAHEDTSQEPAVISVGSIKFNKTSYRNYQIDKVLN